MVPAFFERRRILATVNASSPVISTIDPSFQRRQVIVDARIRERHLGRCARDSHALDRRIGVVEVVGARRVGEHRHEIAGGDAQRRTRGRHDRRRRRRRRRRRLTRRSGARGVLLDQPLLALCAFQRRARGRLLGRCATSAAPRAQSDGRKRAPASTPTATTATTALAST